MNLTPKKDADYSTWLKELKNKVRSVQLKAAVKVNIELLQFYWDLGKDIVEKQKHTQWGDGFCSIKKKLKKANKLLAFCFKYLGVTIDVISIRRVKKFSK
ncbi:MAG: hypothetical protein HQM15_07140 [Deltaproteobacteria bacterium]|nr:hypothetical protein [Deltaproteobacteria bacterium]